jgi:hypothetical protein
MDLPERRQTASAVRRANGARARPRRSSLSPAPSASLLTGSSSPYSTHNGTCSTYTLTLVTAVTPPPQALPTPSPALVCTVRPAPLRPRHSRPPAQPWSAPSTQPPRLDSNTPHSHMYVHVYELIHVYSQYTVGGSRLYRVYSTSHLSHNRRSTPTILIDSTMCVYRIGSVQ